jgi:hypothetical protein
MRLLAVVLTLSLLGCGNDNVDLVKGGTLQSCPNITVEKMVNSFMGNPKWESLLADDNNHYVNISGDITYDEKDAKAVIQFKVNNENNSFEFNAFEINNEPMGELVASALVEKMCESARPSGSMNSEEQSNTNEQELYTRSELKKMLIGKTQEQVIELLGKPSSTADVGGLEMWHYEGISKNEITDTDDLLCQIMFSGNKVETLSFQ